MLCYCIYKMAFQKKIIIVLELIDVFNRLRAWNFYLAEGWAAVRKRQKRQGGFDLPNSPCLGFVWFRCCLWWSNRRRFKLSALKCKIQPQTGTSAAQT